MYILVKEMALVRANYFVGQPKFIVHMTQKQPEKGGKALPTRGWFVYTIFTIWPSNINLINTRVGRRVEHLIHGLHLRAGLKCNNGCGDAE